MTEQAISNNAQSNQDIQGTRKIVPAIRLAMAKFLIRRLFRKNLFLCYFFARLGMGQFLALVGDDTDSTSRQAS